LNGTKEPICGDVLLRNYSLTLKNLEEGEYWKKTSLCYSIVYDYYGAQRYEQFLQVGWLYRALMLLGLALCLPSASVSLVFMLLYI